MDEVSLRCMGCSNHIDVEEAVRRDWKTCERCHFFVCPECLADLGTDPVCLSYACQRLGRKMQVGSIPVEKVLFFAGREARSTDPDGLLYRLFYEENENLDLPFTLVEVPEPEVEAQLGPLTVQEEVWKSHRLVVTKRRRGKFVSWEKIY